MKIQYKIETTIAALILITVLILFGKYYEPKEVTSTTVAPISSNSTIK